MPLHKPPTKVRTQSRYQTPYQTITTLGRGGMGEVFLASQPDAGPRALAVIKRIWPELADEPDFIAMFLDEARLALRLGHRNVVQTYEVGQDTGPEVDPTSGVLVAERGRYFLAMEYLPGQPLSHILRRLRGSDAFSLQLRLQILIDVLRALEYAHDLQADDGSPLGIVHRDISPDNIFVTYDGQVKLMDFGVAKSRFASHQTRPGVFKGRFTYAAPEQVRGQRVDRRCDLFSVGVILWELLTDRRMFRGRTEADVVRTLSGHEPLPALPEHWPIPAELRRISARALALEPRGRYQNATKFRRDLADVLALGLPLPPRPLGGVVARAFRAEKQALEWLIERHFHGAEPWRAAGKLTRLGREERSPDRSTGPATGRAPELSSLSSLSSAGPVSSLKKAPLIWSSFELVEGGLAPAGVRPAVRAAQHDSEITPSLARAARITESAPAVEIGDPTSVENPTGRRWPLSWPQFATGTAALSLAIFLATFAAGSFPRAPVAPSEVRQPPVSAGPLIEPIATLPVPVPADPLPAVAVPASPTPALAPPAWIPAVAAAPAPRPVRRRLETARPLPGPAPEAVAAAVPPSVPAVEEPRPVLSAIQAQAPTLDTQNPYGP